MSETSLVESLARMLELSYAVERNDLGLRLTPDDGTAPIQLVVDEQMLRTAVDRRKTPSADSPSDERVLGDLSFGIWEAIDSRAVDAPYLHVLVPGVELDLIMSDQAEVSDTLPGGTRVGEFHPLADAAVSALLRPGESKRMQLAGVAGIPGMDADLAAGAVAVDLTALNWDGDTGALSVRPADSPDSVGASLLTWTWKEPSASPPSVTATVELFHDGAVEVANEGDGSATALLILRGWFERL